MAASSPSPPSQPRDCELIVQKDVRIPLRDGSIVYADVFRPERGDVRVPAILSLGIYQKDKHWHPPVDLEEKPNPYMVFEAANPLWWCPRDYALVRIDTRGSGKSPGQSEPSSYQEAIDYYDAIEWAARQPWCTGNIGLLGISYLASSQWRVAGLQPPSLKAIVPWEGRADQYRDQAYHGGIFAMGFLCTLFAIEAAHHLLGEPRTYNPDAFDNNLLWNYMRHDLDSDYWRMCSARWDRIEVPLYSAGNWSGFALHLRGNTEGFVNAASKHKKLRVHTGTHIHPFYSEEGRLDQLRFMDYWLKGNDTGIMDEPPVKLEIRTGGSKKPYPFRYENEWPLARTEWTRMYLRIERDASDRWDAIEGQLAPKPPARESKATYPAGGTSKPGETHSPLLALGGWITSRTGLSFETPPMEQDTEITGPLMLNLWVSSTSKDMDLFVTLRNIDAEGKDVWEVGQHGQPVPVTKGWLRASHRKLDPARSLPYRPYHAHDERWWLKPDEPVECQVEIWPTCMVFRKGHKLRLDIQPKDGVGSAPYTHYHADYNNGAKNTIYAGGDKLSYLLLPIIPAKGG
jgi:putative CocE/NonD family hydrolase